MTTKEAMSINAEFMMVFIETCRPSLTRSLPPNRNAMITNIIVGVAIITSDFFNSITLLTIIIAPSFFTLRITIVDLCRQKFSQL